MTQNKRIGIPKRKEIFMAEQKKLSGTQIQLLAIKEMAIVNARQGFQQTLNMIADEHGIKDLNDWILSEDGQYLIEKEAPGKGKKS